MNWGGWRDDSLLQERIRREEAVGDEAAGEEEEVSGRNDFLG